MRENIDLLTLKCPWDIKMDVPSRSLTLKCPWDIKMDVPSRSLQVRV